MEVVAWRNRTCAQVWPIAGAFGQLIRLRLDICPLAPHPLSASTNPVNSQLAVPSTLAVHDPAAAVQTLAAVQSLSALPQTSALHSSNDGSVRQLTTAQANEASSSGILLSMRPLLWPSSSISTSTSQVLWPSSISTSTVQEASSRNNWGRISHAGHIHTNWWTTTVSATNTFSRHQSNNNGHNRRSSSSNSNSHNTRSSSSSNNGGSSTSSSSSGGSRSNNHGWSGGGGDGHGWSTFGAVFGFAAAALLGWPVSALAEAEAKPKASIQESAAAAQARLQEAWGQVEQELDRQKAHLPANQKVGAPSPPQVEASNSGISITLPVHPCSDFNAIMSSLIEIMQSEEGAISVKSRQHGTSCMVSFERSPFASQQDGGKSTFRAQLFAPFSRSESAKGEINIQKSGALTEREIEGFAALLQQANTVVPGGVMGHQPGVYFDPWLGRMHRGWEQGRDVFEQFGQEVDGLFSMMHQADSLFRRFVEEIEGTKERDDDDDYVVEFPPPFDAPSSAFQGEARKTLSEEEFCPLPQRPPRINVQQSPDAQAATRRPHTQVDKAEAQKQEAIRKLQGMGAKVYLPEAKEKMDWGILAGYEPQKRAIEDCLLLPLQHPEIYDKVATGTRALPGSNRPRAVLFEGPPGTGKTTSARVMSSQAALPLVYLPLEAVVSKWYGESEQQLSSVFKACEALGGCILFLDELDALATSRDGEIHEASRRLLSVLLREMDGFETSRRAVVIGATNRQQDLDAALANRFGMTVMFGLPDEKCRQLILQQYAKQLSESEIAELAARTPQMSGRDLRDVCEQTERRWASKIIRGEVPEDKLPTITEYLDSATERLQAGQHKLLPYGLEPQQPPQNL